MASDDQSLVKWWYRRLRKSSIATLGLIIVMFTLMVALFAPFIAPYEPTQPHLQHRFLPPMWSEYGDSDFVFGTDQIGRCVLSRLIWGTRISLIVGLGGTAVAVIIGIAMGLLAGYVGGFVDTMIMRTVDAILSIPNIILYIAILGVFGGSVMTLIICLGVFRWASLSRVVRGEVLSVKEKEYVEAARAIGQRQESIMVRHILPNVLASAIVMGTLMVATTIIAESGLSFLGLGVPPPAVSWGRMLADGRDYLSSAWWLATLPGLSITTTVLGIIFLGDWLRDVLDPRLKN